MESCGKRLTHNAVYLKGLQNQDVVCVRSDAGFMKTNVIFVAQNVNFIVSSFSTSESKTSVTSFLWLYKNIQRNFNLFPTMFFFFFFVICNLLYFEFGITIPTIYAIGIEI